MHGQCLLCGGADLRPMPGYEKVYLTQCGDCGFVFARRIPTATELEAHYSSYGRNDYLSPVTVKRYNEILDFLEPYRKTNRLIDVGCGIGHFAAVAAGRGWEVHGTEYTDEAIAICESKGIRMQKGVLDPANYPPGSFDVIASFEVIEHINNPNEELESFRAILRDGGAVYLTTPNFNSYSRRRLGPDWNVIEYPEHLSYYTAASLTRLMKSHGFRKKWIATTGISLTRYQSSVARASKSPVAKPAASCAPVGSETSDERLRTALESNMTLQLAKRAANALLSATRLGDSMKGLFEKA